MKKRTAFPVSFWIASVVVLLFLAYVFIQYGIYRPEQGAMGGAKKQIADFPWNTWVVILYVHIVTGSLALAAGPVQFLPFAGVKRKALHRGLGKLYVTAIFLSVPAGIYLAFYATGGLASTIAFLALNAAWFATTYIGLRKVLGKNIAAHKEWMQRSYAVTLVFVTFRALLPLSSLAFGFETGFPIGVWAALICNLAVAEMLIRRRRKRASQTRLHVPTVGIQ